MIWRMMFQHYLHWRCRTTVRCDHISRALALDLAEEQRWQHGACCLPLPWFA